MASVSRARVRLLRFCHCLRASLTRGQLPLPFGDTASYRVRGGPSPFSQRGRTRGPPSTWWPCHRCFSQCSLCRCVSTTQRQGEPAWHRRQRRERGNARALLRVAAAAHLTSCHHSGQRQARSWRRAAASIDPSAAPMPNGGKGGKGGKSTGGKGAQGDHASSMGAGPRHGDWACTICGIPDNRSWRARCRICDAYRNKSMAKALEAAGKQQQSLAERQLQQQRTSQQNQRREDSEKKKLKEANAKLAAEVAALKSRQAEQPAADADEDEDMEEGDGDDVSFAAMSEEARARRLELAKGGLAYATERFGDGSTAAAELRQEIAKIQRASREAKPFKAHRAQLERRREKLERQQERDECDIAKAEEEISELQGRVETLRAAVQARAAAISEVSTELTELVRRSITDCPEDSNNGTTGEREETPWGRMSSAIKGLETLPGIPAEFATLLARVQEVAAAMATAASSASPPAAPSANGQQAPAQPTSAAPATPKAPPNVAPSPTATLGRFARGPAKAEALSPPRGTSQQASAADGAEGGEQGSGGKGGAAAILGAGLGAACGQATGNKGEVAQDSGTEMEEEVRAESDPMQVDIESSLAKLPERDQRRLREALGRGKDRGKGAGKDEDNEDNTRRSERERSPRPSKGGEDKDL